MGGPDAIATTRHWDAAAGAYDAAKAKNAPYYDALKDLVATWVPHAHRERVLDIGCGTGQILSSLRPREGVGIDASERMIARATAAAEARPELSFRVLTAEEAGTLGAFDTVISADMLEHVPDWRTAVAAAVRACRPGGRIVLTTPNPLWALPLWVLEKLRLKMPEGPHRFVGRHAIARALSAGGAEVRHVGTYQLVPARLLGLGPALSRVAET
ncbi:MAG: class I SAM-dependent methyltransferase, partial [Planctomycetota bacterium]